MNGNMSKGQRVHAEDLLGSTLGRIPTHKGVNKAGLEEREKLNCDAVHLLNVELWT